MGEKRKELGGEIKMSGLDTLSARSILKQPSNVCDEAGRSHRIIEDRSKAPIEQPYRTGTEDSTGKGT